ncbi:MAG: sigma-70 family RNA polymerase sigma factor [Cyanobium sp.]
MSSARQRRQSPINPAQAELGPSQLHTRNRSWLQSMAASPDAPTRLWWRNALVRHNLGLVRMVAQRQSQRTGRPFDELVSAGGLGLIRAVESFDLRQTCNFSSFAVPFIRGAMLHDVRDHGQPLHTPRRLRELQQRARRLQEQQRGQGLAPLGAAALAEALGCRTAQLEEAAAVQRALQVGSLDAPLGGIDGEEAGCLLDQLVAVDTSVSEISDESNATEPEFELQDEQGREHWLHIQLARLGALEKRLVEGHWIEGLSWKELALELKLTSRDAQRQGDALLAWLQEMAGNNNGDSAMANRAAMAV